MRTIKLLFIPLALLLSCGTMQAQLGGVLKRAAQRGVEKAVTKKVEKKAEDETAKAIDKALDEKEQTDSEAKKSKSNLEKSLNRLDSTLQTIEIDTTIAVVANVEIPQVAATPYTPGESEYAFFGMKKGQVQVVATKDDKGKTTSQTRNTITAITGNKSAFAIEYQSEILDAKGNPADKDNPLVLNYRVVITGGTMYLDMKGMFGAVPGLEGVQVSGTAMKLPTSFKVGQTLPNAEAKVKIGFITCTAQLTEGKVLSEESVSVEAGTFKCYKVSQKVKSSALGIKTEGTTITYYAKGVGAVKTETIDKKGKLMSSTELITN
ncbi:hypothetical protein FACS189413_15220 [Bacteroidia bacterium]|nr:hypothetical protein FACS189413_15220 [Bacteroidia bacterium]